MMQRKLFLYITCTLLSWSSFAQQDSILTLDDFLKEVLKHHPVAFQADLLNAVGDNEVLSARGGFDPKLEGQLAQKNLDDKQYYNYLNGRLKVPTWFGIELDAGYDLNSGLNLNPESYTAPSGLWGAGISIGLGKGLLLDERRAALKQAKVLKTQTQLERRFRINELKFEAQKAYWSWSKSYLKREIIATSLRTAEERYEATRSSAFLGDKPFVDTLKSLIQVQDRAVKLQAVEMEYQNKRAQLSTFLWKDGFIPLELASYTQPESLPLNIPLNKLQANELDTLLQRHPEYQIQLNKIEQAKIDHRLQKEALKPDLRLKYQALSSPGPDDVMAYNPSNFAWGAQLSYPIFTRKERGKARLAALKIQHNQYALSDKQTALKFKVQKSRNTWEGHYNQAQLQRQATTNYEKLLNAEITLFQQGESSLFLINQRDINWLDSQLKWIDYRYLNVASYLEYQFVTQQ